MTTVVSQHTVTALLDGMLPLDLTADGRTTVNLDESWAPYVQAEITIPLPDDVAPFDPRDEHRVLITTRQDWGSSTPVSAISAEFAGQDVSDVSAYFSGLSVAEVSALYYQPFNAFGVRSPERRRYDLMLRDRRIDRARAQMTLSLTSDEAVLIDRRHLATVPFQPGTVDVRAIVSSVLIRIGASLAAGTATGVVDVDAADQQPGTTDWDYLAPLVQKANLRLWCDESRVWRLDDAEGTQPGIFQIDALDARGDDDSIERNNDDIYDAVILTYRWTDTAGAQQVAYDIATTEGWTKAREIVYDDTRYPGPGAAAGVLKRARGRGRIREIEAVAELLVTPAQAATITVGDDTQSGFVSSVTYEWPADIMRVRTRGLVDIPLTAWLFDPPGVGWDDIPAGTDWTEDI